MNVSLTDELESWIEERVASGLYRSSSEVVREALRALREREDLKKARLESIRARVREGVDAYDAGRFTEASDDYVETLEARGRKLLDAKA